MHTVIVSESVREKIGVCEEIENSSFLIVMSAPDFSPPFFIFSSPVFKNLLRANTNHIFKFSLEPYPKRQHSRQHSPAFHFGYFEFTCSSPVLKNFLRANTSHFFSSPTCELPPSVDLGLKTQKMKKKSTFLKFA